MFYKNKPPWPHYQVHEGETPSVVRSGLQGVTCKTIQTITWGNALSSTHGIRITKQTGYVLGSAVGFYQVDIEWPWGAIASITGVGVVTLVTDVLFDALRLQVRSNCDFQLDFDSLDIQLDINGAGPTSVASLGSTTDTGSGYDGRLNDVVTKTQTIISVVPAGVPEYPECADTFADQTTTTLEGVTSSNFDWRYDRGSGWELPEIDFDVLTPPDPTVPGGCIFDCSDPVPGVTSVSDFPRFTITSLATADVTKEDLGLLTCHCPPGTIEVQPGLFNTWDVIFLYHIQESTAGGLPKDAGILNSTKKAAARTWCNDPAPAFTETETTSLDPWTKADFYFYTLKIVNTGFCFEVIQLGFCAVGGDSPDDSISVPCTGGARACAYEAYVQLSHPDLPPCLGDSGDALAYDVSRDTRHARAFGDAGELFIGSMRNVAPFLWVDKDESRASITFAALRWQEPVTGSPLLAFYGVSGGTAKLASTKDEGTTLTDMATITTDAVQGDFEVCADLRIFFFWVETAGSTIKCQLQDAGLSVLDNFDTNITDCDNTKSLRAKESTGSDGHWRMGILYTNLSGDLVFVTSDPRAKIYS